MLKLKLKQLEVVKYLNLATVYVEKNVFVCLKGVILKNKGAKECCYLVELKYDFVFELKGRNGQKRCQLQRLVKLKKLKNLRRKILQQR